MNFELFALDEVFRIMNPQQPPHALLLRLVRKASEIIIVTQLPRFVNTHDLGVAIVVLEVHTLAAMAIPAISALGDLPILGILSRTLVVLFSSLGLCSNSSSQRAKSVPIKPEFEW